MRVSALGSGTDRLFQEGHVAVLTRIASRRSPDDETDAVLGWAIDQMVGRGTAKVQRGTKEWRELSQMLAAVQLESIKRQTERDEGDFSGTSKHPTLTRSKAEPFKAADDARVLGPESLLPLREIVLLMQEERKNVRPGTQSEQRISARMFEEYAGDTVPLHKITRRMVLNYKLALAETPTLYSVRFPGKTLPAAIEANKRRAKPLPTLSPKTINNKWLTHLKATLNWAFANGFIPDNPGQGVRLDQGGTDAAPTRMALTTDDIGKILSSPSFQAEFGERQWAVLIGIYSGMRASEIAQLRLDGIRHERGVLVFSVDGELKNQQSRRLVPVHSALLAHGIEKLIAARLAAGEVRLFPEWHRRAQVQMTAASARGKDIHQAYSHIHPHWFINHLLPKLGIDNARKKFHSLRHTFKTRLSQEGVSREISDAITGHDDQSSGAMYVHAFSVERMKEAIESIAFESEAVLFVK